MWYEEIICHLDKEKSYTRQDIYQILVKENPDLLYNSFKWIISDMVKRGVVVRKQRNQYMLPNDFIKNKEIYHSHIGDQMKELSMMIETRFPMVDFVCFESEQLNEFLNHLIAKNTHFIMVEKDVLDSAFRYLQEEGVRNILLKPQKKEWDAYWTGDDIVMLNLISEFPKCQDGSHSISIEQLLVDVVAEKSFGALYSRSEVGRIYHYANKNYLIDHARLLRYAKRRGKGEEVKKYMEDYTDERYIT